MPIQGLTTTIVNMPPVIGSLRKGGEKEKRRNGDREYEVFGKDLNHFRFTAKNESDKHLVQAFVAAYGATPERIDNIYLPGPEVDDNLMAFCEEYSAAQLIHRCDGVWIYERDSYTGQFYRTNQYCPYAEENPNRRQRGKDGGCKQVGRLHVILPELVRAGYYGVVTVLTHSINDIAKLYQALTNCRERLGPLNRYPFTIYRAMESISTPNGDKRVRRDKSLLNIAPSSEFVLKQFEAVRQAALAAPVDEPRQLLAPVVEVIGGDTLQRAIAGYNGVARRAADAGVPVVPRLTKADDYQAIQDKGDILVAAIKGFAHELHAKLDQSPSVWVPQEDDAVTVWIAAIEEMQDILNADAELEQELEEVQA
jgi:hypothetical protein